MPLIDQQRAFLVGQFAEMQVGKIFYLKALYGAAWKQLGTGLERRKFGTDFKRAVDAQEFPRIEWSDLIGNNRDRPYVKLPQALDEI